MLTKEQISALTEDSVIAHETEGTRYSVEEVTDNDISIVDSNSDVYKISINDAMENYEVFHALYR